MPSIDVQIGKRLEQFRLSAGLDEVTVAKKLKISVAEYLSSEKGTRRLSAVELFDLSRILDVSMSDFFEGTTTQ